MKPLMLTILIPYLFRKNGVEEQATPEKNVGIGESIVLTFKSRPFAKWLIVNCITFFGLQMFLVSQNALISGVMNLGAGWAALLNTCAFAPVPLMLFIFNKLRIFSTEEHKEGDIVKVRIDNAMVYDLVGKETN